MTIIFPRNCYHNLQSLILSDELGYSLMGFLHAFWLSFLFCFTLEVSISWSPILTDCWRLHMGRRKGRRNWVLVYKY